MPRSSKSFFSRNKSVFSLGMIALMISSLGDLLAGATLGYMTDTLSLLPGLMILIPPAIGMRGNIFGALGSRLGTAMHMGTFEASFRPRSILRQSMESSLLLTLIMSLLMGILAKVVAAVFGVASISTQDFVFISVLGGVLAGLVLFFINVAVARTGFKRNWDVDNISAPLITAAGDVITLPMLFLAAIIVLDAPLLLIDALFVIFVAATLILTSMLFRKGHKEVKRVVRQSFPVLTICVVLDIVAGLTIDHQLESLVTLPALLVLIPPFLEDANALGGILTSRFSTELHIGQMEPRALPGEAARENFAIIYIFALWVFTLVGVSSYAVAWLMGLSSPPLWDMVALTLVAGLITVTALNIVAYYVAVSTYRLNLDPDDHSIPLTSSAVDMIGSFALIGVILLMGLG